MENKSKSKISNGMAFVVIETGGKQYRVEEGDTVKIEKLSGGKVGDSVVFDKVLLMDDGTKTVIGTPYIDGAKVEVEISEEGRNKKIEVVKYKAKSRYFKLRGHKQPFMKVKVAKVA